MKGSETLMGVVIVTGITWTAIVLAVVYWWVKVGGLVWSWLVPEDEELRRG